MAQCILTSTVQQPDGSVVTVLVPDPAGSAVGACTGAVALSPAEFQSLFVVDASGSAVTLPSPYMAEWYGGGFGLVVVGLMFGLSVSFVTNQVRRL